MFHGCFENILAEIEWAAAEAAVDTALDSVAAAALAWPAQIVKAPWYSIEDQKMSSIPNAEGYFNDTLTLLLGYHVMM